MTELPEVVVLDDYEGALAASEHLQALRERVAFRFLSDHVERHSLRAAVGPARILVAIRERTRFDGATLEELDGVELLLQTGGHAYHVDAARATAQGLAVSLGRGSRRPTPVVGELVTGLLISWFRGLPAAFAGMQEGRWPAALGRSLHGRRLGILGLGRHGVSVARLGRALGMEVVAWGPTLTSERAAAEDVALLPLDEVLATSDAVTIHLKLSPESTGLIGVRELDLMRPDALLINTSRGPIVDEAALVDALRGRSIGGAALDVFDIEPLPPSHPLRELDNVLLTPHLGYTVDVAFDDFARTTAIQLAAYLDGVLDPDLLLDRAVLEVQRPGPRLGGFLDSGAGS